MSFLSGSTFSNPAAKPSLFGSLGASANQPAQSSSLFGNTGANTQQSSSLFGGAQPQQQQPQTSSLFGTTQQQQPQQQGSSLFGGAAQQPAQQQQGSSLFGGLGASTQQPQQQSGGLFGNTTQQQPQQQAGSSLFGGTTNQQPQQGSSLFGQPQQQQQQQQAPQQIGSLFGQSQSNRVWSEQDATPRQKSVTDQIATVFNKWNPASPDTVFQAYLYNNYDAASAPFFRAPPGEDEDKWEEALQARKNPGEIPVLVRGFWHLGQRIVHQDQSLNMLRGRLVEINNGLSDLLRRHDLEISTRAAECRRRHIRLSQKCLSLAAKTQVLRNRGYAMDASEEELRQKLVVLEKKVFDPALGGRGEEIWARMVGVRERGRILQQEFERAGKVMGGTQEGQTIDEETMKRVKKILEDYDSQLTHLAKELGQIKADYEEWEQGKNSR